jgi:hypothetical protein
MKTARSETYDARYKRLETGENRLRRIGHYIFRLWRAGGRVDGYLDQSLNTVWTLKAQIRAEKRKLRPTPSPNYRKPSRPSGK